MNLQPVSSSQGGPKPIRGWLLGILIIVILIAAGFYGWLYLGKRAGTQPTAQKSAATDELSSLENDLKSVDSDLDQLDKIDASEDETPNLEGTR